MSREGFIDFDANINGFYRNGEPVTKSRIQDEPWYGEYQEMQEWAVMRSDCSSAEELLNLYEEDFEEIFHRKPTAEEHTRFERWAKVEYPISVEAKRYVKEDLGIED